MSYKITLTSGAVIWTTSLEAIKDTIFEPLVESIIEIK